MSYAIVTAALWCLAAAILGPAVGRVLRCSAIDIHEHTRDAGCGATTFSPSSEAPAVSRDTGSSRNLLAGGAS